MSFSFGTPASAPATGLSGGFNFNTNKPATPQFGFTATSQPSAGIFGSTPATSAPAFGSATPAFGAGTTPAFGTAAATPAFGATATPAFGAAAPAFGATSTTPAFGATSAAPAFGATSAAPAFGAASAAPAFGATTTPAFGATAAPGFGVTSTPAFGATTTPAFGTTNAPSFGATGFGTANLNLSAGVNTAAPTTGLFGATTTASAGIGLGGFGTATTAPNAGLSLFGTSTSTASTGLFGAKLGAPGVSGTQPTTSAAPSLGLGGVAPTAGGIGVTNTTQSADGKSEPPKQMKLPNEISTTVDSFKEFIKKQKSLSSDVMRVSIKPLHKVAKEAECTLRQALALSGEVNRARAHSRRLRTAAAAALSAAETAARDLPELEGLAPPLYVKELMSELEQQLITFKRQMEAADKQMQASPKLLSEQELTLGIRRMHESLVALAGRLQAVHTQVEAQKEQYLNMRKYILKDPTNVFETPAPNASLDQILREAEGTRKKTKTGALADVSLGSAVLADPRVAIGNIQQLAGPTPFTYIGSTLSPFPNVDASGTNWQPSAQTNPNPSFNASAFGTTATPFGTEATNSFQLQKPPGKRGKNQ